MLSCFIRNSVSCRKSLSVVACSEAGHILNMSNINCRIGFIPMSNKFGKRGMKTVDADSIKTNQDYEETIKVLNTLQSNAESVQVAVNAAKERPWYPIRKQTTVKYLERSGLSLEDIDKLSVIHVSGTKGKGSTCALTECILRSYGLRTGFFSSPHLVSVTERFRLSGVPICKAKFTNIFWRVYKQLLDNREDPKDLPMYFQFLTILGFHIFVEEKVDVLILEVGVGGELDPTNVVRNTKTIGIPSLGLEHTKLLGETLEEIAWQKAGIIKPYSNVYTSVTQPECLKVIEERAAEKNATVHIVPPFSAYIEASEQQNKLRNLNNVTPLNGSLAIQLAYDWLRNNCKSGSFEHLTAGSTCLPPTVVDALVDCVWPGRCQRLQFLNLNIHLDGAHTAESMCICADWFSKVTSNSQNPKVLIFNSTGDRDARKLMEILRQKIDFDTICFVPNLATSTGNNEDNTSALGIDEQIKRTEMHAQSWHLLCKEDDQTDESRVFHSILDSYNYVQELYGKTTTLDILVTGSLHLVGAAMLALNELNKQTKKSF